MFGPPKVDKQKLSILAKRKNDWPNKEHTAKFVMFKKPFEEVLSAKNLIDIENIKVKTRGEEITDLVENVVKTGDYRAFPAIQEDLLEDGWRYPEDYEGKKFSAGKYIGNKWGGKFFRAPDIFYKILKTGKMRPLGDIYRVKTYLNTGGADNFFIVKRLKESNNKTKITNSSKEWDSSLKNGIEIERQFLKPFIKSPREIPKINISKADAQWKIVIIPEDTNQLKGKRVSDYIKWGEKVGFSRRSGCRNRNPWWKLPKQAINPGKLLWARLHNNRHIVWYNPNSIGYTNCYALWPRSEIDLQSAAMMLNNTIQALLKELFGKVNFGQGVLKTDGNDLRQMLTADYKDISDRSRNELREVSQKIGYREIKPIFEECGIEPNKPIREQEPKPLPDRAGLDNIIFDELGLTKDERKEVYWAVCELVKQRLEKARSLRRK